jgi:putative aldouronate transport system permease protein
LRRSWQLYLLIAPALLYFIVFHYVPMYGVQIAFKNYIASEGIWGSPWVGFDYFERFFRSFQFERLIVNTLLINALQLLLFPVSIIVALSINELRDGFFKRFTQTVTYAPHFISTVIMVGILLTFLHPVTGIVNVIITALGERRSRL